MPLPSYTVELQFGSSSYVDVTQYVQSVSINRGISRVLEDYSAGGVSITFVNNNRVFDPLNTSSPLWYGAGGYTIVQPSGRIRVSSNGIRRFTGFVQTWEFNYDQAGFDGQATVTALDEMYRVSSAVFTGGTAGAVQATSDRMKEVFNWNGFGASEYAGVQGGQTLLGFDTYDAGDSVLSYLQNVARSEPGDFYSNASAVMVFKDRSFTNYVWLNNMRSNYVAYPSNTLASGTPHADSGTWNLIGTKATATTGQFNPSAPIYRGGTVVGVLPEENFVGFEYYDFNPARYSTFGTAGSFSVYLRGISGTYSGFIAFIAPNGGVLTSTSITATSTATTQWVRMSGSLTTSSAIGGIQFQGGAYGSTAYNITSDGWLVEPGTALQDYFDGGWNPGTASATNRIDVAWAGTAYASQSGYLSATASAITAPAILTFADANSQGASFGNGTGIPFTDLQINYASENLYNRVQIIGTNATAIVEDTVGQTRYGLRVYSQTDNLTTSVTRPSAIASSLLAEWRLPEYRAESIAISLESLTTAQQNLVLAIELRDVIRVCFKPSNTGSVIDKYYQVLGIDANADTERDKISFTLASLDNLAIRLDSTILAVLDTDTLG